MRRRATQASERTAVYQQLQEIINKPGCPICGLSQLAVHTYLDMLLWESSTDLNVQEMLVASVGFCGRHSRQLLTFDGQRLAAAVVERASLLAALRRLPELAAPSGEPPARFSFGKARPKAKAQPARPDLPAGVEPCPACIRQWSEEARGIDMLLKHLDEFAEPLLNAGGLCLPHFVQAAHTAEPPARATLLTIEQTVWTELAGLLEEFIRKHMEHHHTDPISDQARLAVERTIAALTGEYPVR
ncbi:MAG TPA: DUF6062 family protein [Caldilineaceae bacterium]|nr:DUF6062 family protein [Caldilineaceae bacterium]